MDVTDKMVEAALAAVEMPIRGQNGIRKALEAALSAALEQEQEAVEHDEVFAQLVLIKQLATDTTDRNWRNKRLYIIQAAARALASPVATREDVVQGWRDISTAPKDGTDILAFNCRHMTHSPVVVFWKTNPDVDMVGPEHHWADAATAQGTALYYNGNYFSHWQPLPAPPALSTLLEGER